ncbi:MAG: hypothetical protein M1831_002563 [Alyxoria varia]|nr:MAG: hypothetical protein M1831_002563 [Alyxoria varia]
MEESPPGDYPADFFMRNVLGPLTTTFTAPPECSTLRGDGIIATRELAFARSQTCTDAEQPVDAPTCWPHLNIPYPSPRSLRGLGLYSPGLHCPVGHTTACSRVQAEPTQASRGRSRKPADDFKFEFDLFAGETGAGCCPIGYDCANNAGGAGQTCIRIATSTTLTQKPCGTDKPDPIALPLTTDDAGKPITVERATLFAPLIQLAWKQSDMELARTKPTPSPNSTNFTTTSQSSNNTPPGSIAGAVVGAILGFIALAAAFFYLLHRIRKRRKAREDSQNGDEKNWEKAELAVDGQTLPMKPVEMFAEHRQELMADQIYELPADNSVAMSSANSTSKGLARASPRAGVGGSKTSGGPSLKHDDPTKGAAAGRSNHHGEGGSAQNQDPAIAEGSLPRVDTSVSRKSAIVSPLSPEGSNQRQQTRKVEDSPISPEDERQRRPVSMLPHATTIRQGRESQGGRRHSGAASMPPPKTSPFES